MMFAHSPPPNSQTRWIPCPAAEGDTRGYSSLTSGTRVRSSAPALAFAEIRRTLAANRMRDGVHIRLTPTRGVKFTSGMDPRLNRLGPTLIVLAEHKAPAYERSGLKRTGRRGRSRSGSETSIGLWPRKKGSSWSAASHRPGGRSRVVSPSSTRTH